MLWGTFFPILSEFVQGHKVTVGPPFFNRVAIPVALLLLLLTAVGPLLAWRKTSLESLKRNFLFPALGSLAIGAMMILFGVRPWQDPSFFYATMAAVLSALVIFTVISEFVRGGRVIAGKSGQNLLSAMIHLCHRNTRRYGGYIVHFGVALVVIGILGTPFNKEVEKEMGFGDKVSIGPYTLVCQSYTQDDNPNYGSEPAIINVFRGGKQITTMYPERRFYKASGQPQTMPNIYPSFRAGSLPRERYLCRLRRQERHHRPSHHQSAPQSARALDLDRPGHHGLRNDHRARAKLRSGAGDGDSANSHAGARRSGRLT